MSQLPIDPGSLTADYYISDFMDSGNGVVIRIGSKTDPDFFAEIMLSETVLRGMLMEIQEKQS
jgi:hypothetical protein